MDSSELPRVAAPPSLRRGAWSPPEDAELRLAVARAGARQWGAVAAALGGRRSAKSCRMRWRNYLRPELTHAPFTARERRAIVLGVAQRGRRWAAISRGLRGRTDNAVKNYWNSSLKKHYAQILAQIREEEAKSKTESSSVLPLSHFQQSLSSNCASKSENPITADTTFTVNTHGSPISQSSCESSHFNFHQRTCSTMETPVIFSKSPTIVPEIESFVTEGRGDNIWEHDNFSAQTSPCFVSPSQSSNFLSPLAELVDGQTSFSEPNISSFPERVDGIENLSKTGMEKDNNRTESSLTELDSLLNNLLSSSDDFFSEMKVVPSTVSGETSLFKITDFFDDFPLAETDENSNVPYTSSSLPQLHKPSVFIKNTNIYEIPLQNEIVPQSAKLSSLDDLGFPNPNWGNVDNFCDKTHTDNFTFQAPPETNGSSSGGDSFTAGPISLETDLKNLISELSGFKNSPRNYSSSPSTLNFSGGDGLSQIIQNSKVNQEKSNIFRMDAVENQTNINVIPRVKPENTFVPKTHNPTFQKVENCEFQHPSSSLSPVSTYLLSLFSKNQSFTF